MKVKLKNVRLSFADLFVACVFEEGSEPKYSATFIVEPESANATALAQAVKAVAEEKFKTRAASVLKDLEKKDRVAYRTEPMISGKTGEVYLGFEGMHWVKASNGTRPLLIDRDRTLLQKEDGKPYSGCYVNASIDVWAQEHAKFGNRINASLLGVQFFRDGEAFGGAIASTDEFDPFDDDNVDDLM